jgi:murein DD-endopeptidase MepM/ murein hydrolase activator NlpD
MIGRRAVLLGGVLLAGGCATTVPLSPPPPPSPRFFLSGSREQGSLVVGRCSASCEVSLDDKPLHVSKDGAFAFGIAFDRLDPLHLSVRNASGVTSDVVTPVARQYEEQRIDGLEKKYVSPPPEILERIKRENIEVAAVRTVDSDLTAFSEPFDWPTAGVVSGTFGSRRILNGEPREPHFGVDIAAPVGAPIRAPADGIVVLAEPDLYLSGGTTILDHGHGVFTTYLHQSELTVAVGASIVRGQTIGSVGRTGRATGPHLHWGMNWFRFRLDPSRSTRTPQPPSA